MVHGLVADGRSWELNVPAVAAHRTIYALDMRNMGRSARVPDAPASLAQTADWLGRVMTALGVTAADLVGSSHGGAVCLMFAARQPERVRSLVLFAPANPFCQWPRQIIRFWVSPPGRALARTLPVLPRFVLDIAHRRVYADPAKARECTLDGFHRGLDRLSIAHLQRIIGSWWQDMAELEGLLEKVAGRPVLLVWGERDGVVSVRSGLRLREVLGARWVLLRGVGHLPFAEDVEGSNSALTKWLRD